MCSNGLDAEDPNEDKLFTNERVKAKSVIFAHNGTMMILPTDRLEACAIYSGTLKAVFLLEKS